MLLFDFSNHWSALLLSPESSLPVKGLRLEGELLEADECFACCWACKGEKTFASVGRPE